MYVSTSCGVISGVGSGGMERMVNSASSQSVSSSLSLWLLVLEFDVLSLSFVICSVRRLPILSLEHDDIP